MAHQIENMAYIGTTPWHGLGSRLTEKQPLEVWQREAGMDWQIQESPVHFKADAIGHLGSIHSFPAQKVLFRSDTKAPLSVVFQRYQVVQPREVLEFYRDLTERSGYELETAGVLKDGRKLWALARTGQSTALKGSDVVNGYLLLATSCDGTLATTATPTTIRVVCNNTLTIAINGATALSAVPESNRNLSPVTHYTLPGTTGESCFALQTCALAIQIEKTITLITISSLVLRREIIFIVIISTILTTGLASPHFYLFALSRLARWMED